ncbi:hypothetical protein PR048_032473 [Dryococelus australis]|uniref:FLYWCH-type domain-containing protein n=1 Tax=Dryococelus australis TaxID=614101 RepID=A0ABQ9G342_9NEOP|nr:hypothetical protein PR048_032473 [Dryococelus australis]
MNGDIITLMNIQQKENIQYVLSQKGKPQLVYNNYLFNLDTVHQGRKFWHCYNYRNNKCHARAITEENCIEIRHPCHNHEPHTNMIEKKKLKNLQADFDTCI